MNRTLTYEFAYTTCAPIGTFYYATCAQTLRYEDSHIILYNLTWRYHFPLTWYSTMLPVGWICIWPYSMLFWIYFCKIDDTPVRPVSNPYVDTSQHADCIYPWLVICTVHSHPIVSMSPDISMKIKIQPAPVSDLSDSGNTAASSFLWHNNCNIAWLIVCKPREQLL